MTPAAAPRDEEVEALAKALWMRLERDSAWEDYRRRGANACEDYLSAARFILDAYTTRAASEWERPLRDLEECLRDSEKKYPGNGDVRCATAHVADLRLALTRPTPATAPATEKCLPSLESLGAGEALWQHGETGRTVTMPVGVHLGPTWRWVRANPIVTTLPPAPVPPATKAVPLPLLSTKGGQNAERSDRKASSQEASVPPGAQEVEGGDTQEGGEASRGKGPLLSQPAKGEEGAGALQGQPFAIHGDETHSEALFWTNPFSGKEEKIATFWWPTHPKEWDVDGWWERLRTTILDALKGHDAAALLREAHFALNGNTMIPSQVESLLARIDAYLKGHDAAAHDGRGGA